MEIIECFEERNFHLFNSQYNERGKERIESFMSLWCMIHQFGFKARARSRLNCLPDANALLVKTKPLYLKRVENKRFGYIYGIYLSGRRDERMPFFLVCTRMVPDTFYENYLTPRTQCIPLHVLILFSQFGLCTVRVLQFCIVKSSWTINCNLKKRPDYGLEFIRSNQHYLDLKQTKHFHHRHAIIHASIDNLSYNRKHYHIHGTIRKNGSVRMRRIYVSIHWQIMCLRKCGKIYVYIMNGVVYVYV